MHGLKRVVFSPHVRSLVATRALHQLLKEGANVLHVVHVAKKGNVCKHKGLDAREPAQPELENYVVLALNGTTRNLLFCALRVLLFTANSSSAAAT